MEKIFNGIKTIGTTYLAIKSDEATNINETPFAKGIDYNMQEEFLIYKFDPMLLNENATIYITKNDFMKGNDEYDR